MGAIAFSYEIATATGQVRLYAGDTDGSRLNESGGDRTRTDEEIAFFADAERRRCAGSGGRTAGRKGGGIRAGGIEHDAGAFEARPDSSQYEMS